MKNKIGDQTIKFTNCPRIIGNYAIVGEKEGNGTFKDYYDFILKDDLFGEKTFEHAERKIIEQAISQSIEKAKLNISDIDLLIGGDLLNQIISMSFTARYFDRPFLGVYGACSTMAESLAIGAALVNAEYVKNVVCSTGSHFSSAERQYRFPLELGNQRPPTSQWTVTGAGSSILSLSGEGHKITMATFGKVTDYGVSDVNNMGAAMAPAAVDTIYNHFKDTGRTPKDYDVIATGDLGKVGKEITTKLLLDYGYDVKDNYVDCGDLIFDDEKQKTDSGGSGCGCSAVVTCGYFYKKLMKKEIKSLLLVSTGALMSTTSSLQGESIPGIAHAVAIEYK